MSSGGAGGVFAFKEHKIFAVVVFAEDDALNATFGGVKVDGLQQGVEPGHGYFALFDGGENAGVVGTHKAKFAIRGDMALNLVAIVPALAALGDVAECLGGIDASDATELVANGFEFGFRLLLVGHVLIVATATNREIFTSRGNTMGGELLCQLSAVPRVKRAFSCVISREISSSGRTKGTKTARPSERRPSPSPP